MLEENLRRMFREAQQEGRREGQILGQRKALLDLLAERFGRLPKGVRSRVEQINSTQELERLTRKVLSVKSLEEMGLGLLNGRSLHAGRKPEKVDRESPQEAFEEGRQQGLILAFQTVLLQQMTFRFGRLPANVRR